MNEPHKNVNVETTTPTEDEPRPVMKHTVCEAINTASQTFTRQYHYESNRYVTLREAVVQGQTIELPDVIEVDECKTLVMWCNQDVVLHVNDRTAHIAQLERDTPLVWHIGKETRCPLGEDAKSLFVQSLGGDDAIIFVEAILDGAKE